MQGAQLTIVLVVQREGLSRILYQFMVITKIHLENKVQVFQMFVNQCSWVGMCLVHSWLIHLWLDRSFPAGWSHSMDIPASGAFTCECGVSSGQVRVGSCELPGEVRRPPLPSSATGYLWEERCIVSFPFLAIGSRPFGCDWLILLAAFTAPSALGLLWGF